jgi:glutamate-1-semialdehyde 2,1-aminomutase
MDLSRSRSAFARAEAAIPGGVNSPVRAFGGVGGDPVFFASGAGAHVTDIDGNRYLDFVGSWGPLILGHAHPEVVEAVCAAAKLSTSFGAPTERETELAELIISMVPSVEMVRLVNSGTEAAMSAIRLARGATGREKIVKFEGCYHGHADSFLIAAGSGATTLGIPDSLGVTAGTASDTLVAPFNDIASVAALFEQHGKTIAAVIVEPVAGNMGVVPPEPGFLQGLRDITKRNGALLIFDEVITGFRLSPSGAQQLYNCMPDITTLGKTIGGGLPVGAYGGSRDIMSNVAPAGKVYQAGTLSGNPCAVAAGLATLKVIQRDPAFHGKLDLLSERLAAGITKNCRETGISAMVNRVGSMMTLFFTGRKRVFDYKSALASDRSAYARYFHATIESGVYIAPSQFEAMFVSSAHTVGDIDIALAANKKALGKLA